MWVPLGITMLAGCLSSSGPEAVPAPGVTDAQITEGVDWWEALARSEIKRDSNTPGNDAVREWLIGELEAIGMDVEVREYPAQPRGAPVPDGAPLHYYAVVATKTGATLPDHRVGLVSHYDTQTLTFQGAYDDASGVAAQFTICKALMEVELDRTLACIFFDAEEQGLVASQQYVDDVVVEGDEGYVYDWVLGYDMTGINWPGHDWSMYLMSGDDEHQPYLWNFGSHVMHDLLGYPRGGGGVEVLDVHDRNSDERRFRDEGIPIFRFAGGRNAADYPQYHMPDDTVEYVYDFVDGRANFEAGFKTVVEGSVRLVWELDATTYEQVVEDYA